MATEPLPLQKTAAPAPQDAVPAAGSTGEPLVRFEKVVKRYGDHVVLDQLDFTVDRG
ncbi:L-cystine ABC transporter ATP-binding protein YecC, partial [Streptomyces cyaneofuscatus]